MTHDLQALRILLARTESLRDEAVAERIRLDAARAAAQAQAEQLALYRSDYEARWQQQFCREGQIELVRCYQGFMQRLTQAVDQQRQVAVHATQRVERAAALALGHEVRAAAIGKLIARRERLQQQHEARIERRADDERAHVAWAAGGAGLAMAGAR